MSNVCQIIAWNLLPETDVQSLCRELSRQIDIIHPLWKMFTCIHPVKCFLSWALHDWASLQHVSEIRQGRCPHLWNVINLVWNLILHYLTLLRTTINQAVNPVLNQLRFCEARTRHLCLKLERFGARTFPSRKATTRKPWEPTTRRTGQGCRARTCHWQVLISLTTWVRHGHACRVKQRHTSITRTDGVYNILLLIYIYMLYIYIYILLICMYIYICISILYTCILQIYTVVSKIYMSI